MLNCVNTWSCWVSRWVFLEGVRVGTRTAHSSDQKGGHCSWSRGHAELCPQRHLAGLLHSSSAWYASRKLCKRACRSGQWDGRMGEYCRWRAMPSERRRPLLMGTWECKALPRAYTCWIPAQQLDTAYKWKALQLGTTEAATKEVW